jgi:hypothetical protein
MFGLVFGRNPTLRQVWGWNSHSQKWELGVLWDSRKLRAWLQGSKHLALRCSLYLEKVLKRRCRKWPCMSHLNTCNTSYGQKKGRESNWQFDSRPLKVGNQPDPDMCRWIATHRWKALEESYNFTSDLIPIRGLRWELWASKVSGVQTGTVSGLILGSPETKSHSDVGAVSKRREYYMGEGGGFPRVRAVVSQVSLCCPWLA